MHQQDNSPPAPPDSLQSGPLPDLRASAPPSGKESEPC